MRITRHSYKSRSLNIVLLLLGAIVIKGCGAQTNVINEANANSKANLIFSSMWVEYKNKFISKSGYLTDSYHKISHSEGQGTAMLFAAIAGDIQTFEDVWIWTKNNLQRPDKLFAWRWDPRSSPHITDYNNATDGDVLIAWALLVGYEKWGKQIYREQAKDIVEAIKKDLVVRFAGRQMLLPGSMYYFNSDSVTLNLSYFILPALKAFASYDDLKLWNRVYMDGLYLIETAGESLSAIPSDWIDLTSSGDMQLSPKHGSKTGYDAIRIPLYLAWCGHQKLLVPYKSFWKNTGGWKNSPSWINLQTYDRAHYPPEPGILSIRSLSYVNGNNYLLRHHSVKDYFSSSLVMFSLLAEQKTGCSHSGHKLTQ